MNKLRIILKSILILTMCIGFSVSSYKYVYPKKELKKYDSEIVRQKTEEAFGVMYEDSSEYKFYFLMTIVISLTITSGLILFDKKEEVSQS